MSKRKAVGDRSSGVKAIKAGEDAALKVPVDALLREEVRLFDAWLNLGLKIQASKLSARFSGTIFKAREKVPRVPESFKLLNLGSIKSCSSQAMPYMLV